MNAAGHALCRDDIGSDLFALAKFGHSQRIAGHYEDVVRQRKMDALLDETVLEWRRGRLDLSNFIASSVAYVLSSVFGEMVKMWQPAMWDTSHDGVNRQMGVVWLKARSVRVELARGRLGW